jgi:hypothetical protein
MNDNSSLNMKAIGNGLPNRGHRVKGQFVKQRPQPLPQQPFTARFGLGRLEQLTGQLLGLVYGKGQHHQLRKDDR